MYVATPVDHVAPLTVRTSLPMERPDPTPVTAMSSTFCGAGSTGSRRFGAGPLPTCTHSPVSHRRSGPVLVLNLKRPARPHHARHTGKRHLGTGHPHTSAALRRLHVQPHFEPGGEPGRLLEPGGEMNEPAPLHHRIPVLRRQRPTVRPGRVVHQVQQLRRLRLSVGRAVTSLSAGNTLITNSCW